MPIKKTQKHTLLALISFFILAMSVVAVVVIVFVKVIQIEAQYNQGVADEIIIKEGQIL